MKTILLVPTGEGVGLTSACLGLIYALECQGVKAGFLKPFAQELNEVEDRTTALYRHISQSETVEPIRYSKVLQQINLGEQDELLEEAVRLHRQIARQHDLIIVEGLLPNAQDSFADDLNASLAQALDAKVIVVSNANIQQPGQTADKVENQIRNFGGASSTRLSGILLMRTKGLPEESAQIPVTLDPDLRLAEETTQFIRAIQQTHPHIGSEKLPVIGLVPFSKTLSVPRISDLAAHIQAYWINEGEAKQRRVQHSSLISANIEHELHKFVAGELIISASDRIDVLLASSLASSNGIPLAGLVLTEHHQPNDQNLSNEIPVDDTERADQVTRFVSSHINPEWLGQMLNGSYKPRLSPSAFRHELVQKSIAAKKRIVLPEGDEPRTIQAAAICQSRGIAQCILLANPESVLEVAKARGIELPEDLEILDPDLIRDNYIDKMVELRKGKLNELQAREQLQDTVVLGTMMLALDQVDGLVSGAVHTTANTVRPAFQLIKTAPDCCQMKSMFMATVRLILIQMQSSWPRLRFNRQILPKPLALTRGLP